MVNEIKEILKLLIENKEEKFSIRKISQIREINYKSAYNAVLNLEKQGIVNIEKIGNANLCSFTNNFNPLVFEAEYERRKKILKNSNFKVIFDDLIKINTLFILLLFGSYAKNMQNKQSDIDFLVISENFTEIQAELSLIPLNIHLTTITPKEFKIMAQSKEFTVVSEAMRNNIIFIGIEEYYKLLKNANTIKSERSTKQCEKLSRRKFINKSQKL